MSVSQMQLPRLFKAVDTTSLLLFAAIMFAWGFSWIAMKGQVGIVAPEVSVFWRFMLAAAVMMAWAKAKGERLRFPFGDHLRFIGLGALIFSTNFTLFYYGAEFLTSGLLAVVFSTASIFNLLLSFLIFRERIGLAAFTAGMLGFTGVGLMFWHEVMGAEFNASAALGLKLCIAGTLCFCLGNMLSASTQRKGISVVSASSWGMVYGMILLGLFAFARGKSFAIDWSPVYLGTLVFLAVVASVIAFGSYLTLLGRIGSARAGYVTVLFPIVALAVSTVLEGYQWTIASFTGLACVLAGNLLMMRKS